jgi:hypothetical protein
MEEKSVFWTAFDATMGVIVALHIALLIETAIIVLGTFIILGITGLCM